MGCLQRYGVPEQVLTENGIRHLLTAPRSPTTTGKVERLHKRMRAELFADADCVLATVGELQAALDARVSRHNTERARQWLGMRPPAQRFALAAGRGLEVVQPVAALPTNGHRRSESQSADLGSAGVQRWVSQRGSIRLAAWRCTGEATSTSR